MSPYVTKHNVLPFVRLRTVPSAKSELNKYYFRFRTYGNDIWLGLYTETQS